MDYRTLVRQRAEALGLDPNLAESVMIQESGGRPNVVSSAGARGLMQLMPGTAKELGVDPNDPTQNIDGGVRYLKQQIDRFGIPGGLAAYNAGPGRFQKVAGNFDALPQETRNYVPSVMNRTVQIAQGGKPVAEPTQAAPQLGLPQYMSAFEKAKAANDTEALAEIGGALNKQFGDALSRAQAANDAEAVKEIQGMMGRFNITPAPAATPAAEAAPAPQATPEPAKPVSRFDLLKQEGKKVLSRADDLVRGVADMATFGYADEIAAKLDSLTGGGQSGKTNYDEALKAQRQRDKDASGFRTAGQVLSAVIPSGVAIRAVDGATKLARVGAGAATGALQGGLYASGSSEKELTDPAILPEIGLGAGGGALLGGALTAVIPTTVKQEANRFIRKSGSDSAAKVDAEIVRDLNKIASNENARGNPVQALQANALETKYVKEVENAFKSIGKKTLEKTGLKGEDINAALQQRRIITPDELSNLRNTKAGTALADAIEKAQRTRSLTAPVPASDNPLARTGRTLLDLAPIPQPLRYAGQRILGARSTREDVINKMIDPKTASAAEDVLARLGPSDATQSLSRLQQMAQKAQTGAQAQQAQQAASRTQSLAQQAQTKNQVLQSTRVPQGGGFQELLTGGRSGLNMSTEQGIDALRIISKMKKDNPVGKAAQEMLQSKPVSDPNAFYGVQNMIRRLSEEGKLVSGSPNMGAASSGIRNPISYAANVRTAEEAAKLARESAPSKALGQFANKVAGTKAPADKLALVEGRLAKATDPAEIEFLENIVRPLANFGKK
jgi:hypothetical protein